MQGPRIVINQYTDSATGHANVSFYGPNNVFLGTFGANVREVDLDPFNGLEGGLYDETNLARVPSHTSTVWLNETQFWNAWNKTADRMAEPDDYYFLVGQNCVDFVSDILWAAGQGLDATAHFISGSLLSVYASMSHFFQFTAIHDVFSDADLPPYLVDGQGQNFFEGMLNVIGQMGGAIIKAIVELTKTSHQERLTSPIVIDLGGDGVETTSLASDPIYFDIDGDGEAEATGWISSDDAFLVMDLNGDQQINSVLEMFGGPNRGDGYAELSLLDSNRDGVLDGADEGFSNLQLWTDLNSNGVTDAGELFALSDKGVASIDLSYMRSSVVDNGNLLGEFSFVGMADGSRRHAVDVYFQYAEA